MRQIGWTAAVRKKLLLEALNRSASEGPTSTSMAWDWQGQSLQYTFSITFPKGNTHHKEPFLLCFEEQAVAEEWRDHVLSAIGSGLPHRASNASALGDSFPGESPWTATPGSAPNTPPKARVYFLSPIYCRPIESLPDCCTYLVLLQGMLSEAWNAPNLTLADCPD